MAIEKIRHVSGTALPLRGDSIDTDRIIPARFLQSVSFEGLEQHLFEDDRTQADASAPGTHPISNPRLRRKLDTAGEREFRLRLVARARAAGNPPAGHSRRGGRVVFGNLLRQLRRARSAVRDRVARRHGAAAGARRNATPTTTLSLDLGNGTVSGGGATVAVSLPAAARESFLEGTWDATGMLLDRYEDVEAVASRLPYVTGWR